MVFLSRQVLVNRKAVIIVFLILSAICGFMAVTIKINNDMADYLPEETESTIALELMSEEFGSSVPNARVMVSGITLSEAEEYKEKLKAIEGVSAVMWLDDILSLKQPLEMADSDIVQEYYKDNTALFSVTIETGYESSSINAIYALNDDNTAISGDAASAAFSESLGSSESTGAMLILIPLIIIILLLTTTSWLEPILYFGAIGAAIVINLGLTAMSGEISYITMAVGPILQLAVSLDYSIFLLHSFETHRKETDDVVVAMQRAMKSSFSAIAASAATTLFGFLALLLMKFRIGSDMGLVLAKGILMSYVSVMVFLPALTLCFYKLLDKTRHKRIIPDFKIAGKVLMKIRIPALLLALAVVVPCFIAKNHTDFLYGNGAPQATTRYGADTIQINEKFGQSVSLIILVPKGEPAKELALCNELIEAKNISSVASYVSTISSAIPAEYLDHALTDNFYSKNYARIILACDTADEGDEAFAVVENVRRIAMKHYEKSYTCGQSAILYDIKNVVSSDNTIVSIAAVIAIALTLFVTFKSLSLPLILLAVIETAIWINLSFPYFAGSSLCYLGYLVISTVQLGATIDYAILFTESYMTHRQLMNKKEAMRLTFDKNILSVMVSVLTLAGAGFCLYFTSSNTIIAELGLLLGRGTTLSFILVVCVLPALLTIFDKVISKTTLKPNFYKGGLSK